MFQDILVCPGKQREQPVAATPQGAVLDLLLDVSPSHCLHQLKIIVLNPNRKWFAHTTTASMQGRAFLLERSSTTRFKIEIEEKIWCITSGADIFVKRKQIMTPVNQKVCHSWKCGNTHFMLFCSSVLNQVWGFPACVLCFWRYAHSLAVWIWSQIALGKTSKWPFTRQQDLINISKWP